MKTENGEYRMSDDVKPKSKALLRTLFAAALVATSLSPLARTPGAAAPEPRCLLGGGPIGTIGAPGLECGIVTAGKLLILNGGRSGSRSRDLSLVSGMPDSILSGPYASVATLHSRAA